MGAVGNSFSSMLWHSALRISYLRCQGTERGSGCSSTRCPAEDVALCGRTGIPTDVQGSDPRGKGLSSTAMSISVSSRKNSPMRLYAALLSVKIPERYVHGP